MTSIPERQSTISLIQQANRDGARLTKACAEAGICLRTYRRWYRPWRRRVAASPTTNLRVSVASCFLTAPVNRCYLWRQIAG